MQSSDCVFSYYVNNKTAIEMERGWGEQRILLLISVKFASEIIFVVFEVTFVSVREGVGGGRRDESKNGVGGGVRI